MKHITIKDIARELGVSISTVSRAFNDKYDIRKETKERILKKATELNFHPSPTARNLISRTTKTIGVVVPEFLNSFFPEVIIGIQEVLHKKNYQVLIMQSNESYQTELENVKTLEQNMVDGMILSLSSETSDVSYYQELIEKGYPIVLFNRVSDKLPTHKVLFDDYKWAFFATEHLIYQGYKNILHFSGPGELSLSQNRENGFKDALRKHKITIQQPGIIETGFKIEDGEREMDKLIKSQKLPEALFAVNDATAFGAMKSLNKHGLRIPEDLALVGFSESAQADLVAPPLTSVAQPTHDIGTTAAQLLLEQIESKALFVPQTIVLNGRLNVRESSLKITKFED